MNALILIAEDEPQIAAVLDAYLVREGFRTVRAADGQTALDLSAALRPDLVLLDVRMPRLDGWAVLSELRRRGETPVIMLTALDQDIDKLQALRIGADDYVVKPFNPVEVVARTQAILRRSGGSGQGGVIRLGDLEIDLEAHIVQWLGDGHPRRIALTLTEFRLLAHMARYPMRVFSRAELADACMRGDEVLDRTVDSHLSKLRAKLRKTGLGHIIVGVRGVGYRLEAAP